MGRDKHLVPQVHLVCKVVVSGDSRLVEQGSQGNVVMRKDKHEQHLG